jgi:hypothetical protein
MFTQGVRACARAEGYKQNVRYARTKTALAEYEIAWSKSAPHGLGRESTRRYREIGCLVPANYVLPATLVTPLRCFLWFAPTEVQFDNRPLRVL